MKFFFTLFLIYVQQNKLNIFIENSNTFNKIKNSYKYGGYDYRHIKNNTDDEDNLRKIYKYFENKKLLDILKNENISLSTKLVLLQDNRIKSSNIYAGGLMKDFDFEF